MWEHHSWQTEGINHLKGELEDGGKTEQAEELHKFSETSKVTVK